MTKSCACLIMTTCVLAGCAQPKMQRQTAAAGFINYRGYPDCIKLDNDSTTVILGPHCGGRVLRYSLNGSNILYMNPKQNGWLYERGKRTIDPDGGRFDIGPENIIPKHPDLWLGGWQAEIIGPRAARLTSVKDKATGTQLVREFTLDEASSKLTCKQIIKNVSDQTKKWCHWSRTLAAGAGICIVPLTADSRFPHKYIMFGPVPVMNFRPNDPNIIVGDNFIEIIRAPKQPKLGMDSYAGWLCYLAENDLMFVKRFGVYPDRVYNEMAAITISIYYYKNIMCELEPIGPMEKLAPGQSASYIEQWWLLPYKFPSEDRKANLAELQQIIATQAR